MPRFFRRASLAALITASGLGAACSPVLDWREVRPASSDLTMLFPCRPGTEQRSVQLGAAKLPLRLIGCKVRPPGKDGYPDGVTVEA